MSHFTALPTIKDLSMLPQATLHYNQSWAAGVCGLCPGQRDYKNKLHLSQVY